MCVLHTWIFGETMATSIQECKNSKPMHNKNDTRNCNSSMTQNVVFLNQSNTKKELARAKLLRAAQKIRW